MAATRFVSVNLTPAARDRLRVASLRISMEAGRKVSMADALLILADVAETHPDEIRERAAAFIESREEQPE
ncbi:hypothetical protein [Streptomyces soliscabiei]|uniref:hypothetical protein n=1 Tax=Streptomyces soliscabiei TaxID=588897 RepID=UPI0029AA1E72|nr:hypothetical protein [Streptomyces sp. NY05-11A]MDX2683689.1 hypothetical protein [Streptomyces sp. NY05-11A]